MKPLSIIETINYEPVSWMHPSRLPEKAHELTGVRRAILNKTLLNKHALTAIDEQALANHKVALICSNWRHLKMAAHYMACYRHKSAIMQSLNSATLSHGARLFMQLALKNSYASQMKWKSRINIDAMALAELMLLSADFPFSVKRRLELMFNHDGKVVEHHCSVDMNLFIMAITHAKNYP